MSDPDLVCVCFRICSQIFMVLSSRDKTSTSLAFRVISPLQFKTFRQFKKLGRIPNPKSNQIPLNPCKSTGIKGTQLTKNWAFEHLDFQNNNHSNQHSAWLICHQLTSIQTVNLSSNLHDELHLSESQSKHHYVHSANYNTCIDPYSIMKR